MKGFNKEYVKRAFSSSAKTYDTHAALQLEAARELAEYIPKGLKPQSVVDAGCGTGFLTGLLLERFPQAEIFCFDIALPMVERVRERFKRRVVLFNADCEALPLESKGFDLVASNLTYQWMPEPLCAFREVARVLKEGGYFVFSTLGSATFEELKASVEKAMAIAGRDGLPPFMEFREVKEIEHRLERAGFREVRIKRRLKIKSYESLWQFLKTLKHTGATNPHRKGSRSLSRGALLKEVEKVYKREYPSDKGIRASYDLIYVVARK